MARSRSSAGTSRSRSKALERCALVLGLVTLGCGGAPRAREEEPVELSAYEDPPAYTPPPQSTAVADEVGALRPSTGHDVARRIVQDFVVAFVTADEARFEALLDDPLGLGHGMPTRRRVPRERLITALRMVHATQGSVERDPRELVELSEIEVRPLREVSGGAPLPDGYQGTDLLVVFPLAAEGTQLFVRMFQWREQGTLIIRPGEDPRIISF